MANTRPMGTSAWRREGAEKDSPLRTARRTERRGPNRVPLWRGGAGAARALQSGGIPVQGRRRHALPTFRRRNAQNPRSALPSAPPGALSQAPMAAGGLCSCGLGSRCLTPVLWHESPDWALGTLGIVASIFLLKKFHLERRLFIYILPLLALMIFFNIIDTVNIHPNTLIILTRESHIPPDILDGLISAIFSLLFSPLFFKEMTILKSIRKIPLITFFIYIALSKCYLSILTGIAALLLSIGLGGY